MVVAQDDYTGICFRCDRDLWRENMEEVQIGLSDEEFQFLTENRLLGPGAITVLQHKQCPPRFPLGWD